MAPKGDRAATPKAHWTDAECLAAIGALAGKKDTHQSGNGWKDSVWTIAIVVKAIHEAKPDALPMKDVTKCKTKIGYLKTTFEEYLFIEKYSGSGWDDDKKHVTNTDEYIQDFLLANGKQYAKCFKTPCPYYSLLNSLYDGMRNRATGDNVVHLSKQFRKKNSKQQDESEKENENTGPSAGDGATAGPSNIDADIRAPMAALDTTTNDCDEDSGSSANNSLTVPYADELSMGCSPLCYCVVLFICIQSPVKTAKRHERAESEDETDVSNEHRKHKKSDSPSIMCRNAEAGSQLSHSIDNLSAAMGKPIVTAEDLGHINEIVRILKDKTLLPPDPKGKLFRLVSGTLSRDAALARVFILEEDPVRCKGMLEGILEEAGVVVPDDFQFIASQDDLQLSRTVPGGPIRKVGGVKRGR
ncbi:hypothetical protein C8R43DRAFT_1115793 [Mycena crocata]|nr:hypothetical protein C8R43DRAFT_1115793 [Mycena crocata]